MEWRLSIVHYRAFDHRIYGVAEYLNVSLAFSPSSFSSSCSSFSFFLSHMFKDRHCVIVARLSLYRAHAGAVNDLSQRFDNRLKIFVQYHVLFDSTFRVRCFLRISSRSLSRLFRTSIHVRLWRSIDKDWSHYGIGNFIKSFSISPIFKRTVLVYH